MLPSSCLDGSVTPVGPGQNPQYTGAVQRREAVGCSQGLKMSPQKTTDLHQQEHPIVDKDLHLDYVQSFGHGIHDLVRIGHGSLGTFSFFAFLIQLG